MRSGRIALLAAVVLPMVLLSAATPACAALVCVFGPNSYPATIAGVP